MSAFLFNTIGMSALRGEQGAATLAALDTLAKHTALVSEEWNGINTLHTVRFSPLFV